MLSENGQGKEGVFFGRGFFRLRRHFVIKAVALDGNAAHKRDAEISFSSGGYNVGMSNPNMPDPFTQFLTDLRAIVVEVEQLTGLQSRWSGVVNLSSNPLYLGAKQWNCDIDIDQSLLTRPRRYSTGLHEVLHSVSMGLNSVDYPQWAGYEEGIVEQCTRLLRDDIFAALGFAGPFDVRNSYPYEIAALEALRVRANSVDSDFYLHLLQTPLSGRDRVVLQWIQQAEPTKSPVQIEQETLTLRGRLKI